MADNVTANAGAGGATFATDDIGGVQYPRAKVVWGADGAANDTSAAAPLPVVQTGAHEVSLDAATLAALETINAAQSGVWNITNVSGTVSLPTGAATEVTLASALTALQTIDNIVAGNEAQVDVITLPSIPAGTNNIGDVDIASIAAGDNNIGNVDIVTMPAIAATASNIGAQISTSAIMDGTTACTPKFAVIDAATNGDNTIISANATKKLRVLAAFLVSSGTVNVRFEGGAGGTALTGQMNLVANSGFVLPFNPAGWFETASNTLLNLELSGAVSVDGCLTYIEV